jgi:hypothetical protein
MNEKQIKYDETVLTQKQKIIFKEVKGYEEYIQDAEDNYYLYYSKFNNILIKYQLNENMTIMIEKLNSKNFEQIIFELSCLKEEFIQRFEDDKKDEKEMLKKCYAWFYFVYRGDFNVLFSKRFLHFVWNHCQDFIIKLELL